MNSKGSLFSVLTYLNQISLQAVQDVIYDLSSQIPDNPIDSDTVMALTVEVAEIMGNKSIVSGGKHSDFRFNLLIPVFRKVSSVIGDLLPKKSKLNPPKMAEFIQSQILEIDTQNKKVIGTSEIAKVYINFNISLDFLIDTSLRMADLADKSELMTIFNRSFEGKIVMDYSSPNIAKEMHVGHLRSTIIGDSLYRMLRLFIPKDQILCLNHVGDWGTQFGMIINYFRHINNNDFDRIMQFLEGADSSTLLDSYKSAKRCFDNKDGLDEYVNFANESRHQTFCLQQGDKSDTTIEIHNQNYKIWQKICHISSEAYADIYQKLRISPDLIERGESFYNPFIPDVVQSLKEKGIAAEKDGAIMINLDGWEFPLIVVKSDGGYTYATTDLAAIWHRTHIEEASKIIYITDKGQWPHFEKVFAVAKDVGWLNNTEVVHIGFGLVSGEDGKKLKTRAGDAVKLADVIDDVTTISHDVIQDRADRAAAGEDVHEKYALIDQETIVDMSEKIGVNTLKYFDLSFLYTSDYKYDPKKMFEFKGDTGVYQMYCYCRILSIIDKSVYGLEDMGRNASELLTSLHSGAKLSEIQDFKDLTDIDRDLLFQLSEFVPTFEASYNKLSIKPVMDYIKNLTSQFNRFVSKQNVKILDATDEKYRVLICSLCYKILDEIFGVLGFGKIDFI